MMQRMLIIFALLACNVAWASGRVSTADDAAVRAAGITQKYSLSKDNTECLYFDTADKGSYWLIRVRENHTDACGGDPEVSPVLFFMKMRKRDGYTTTTAYDGERYRPLRQVSP